MGSASGPFWPTVVQVGNGGTTGSIVGPVTLSGGATIAFDRSDSYTFSGDVSGTGTIQQNGSGKLIYTGTAGASVGVTVWAGTTMQIGNGGTTGSFGGSNNIGGTLIFNRSDSYTYGGTTIGGGTGNFEQAGSGTLILTGNIYTATTTIDAGSTLQLGNGGTTGWLSAVNLVNNGTLIFNRSDSSQLGANITGTGSVQQSGGTTVLTGSSTYSGGTTIATGSTLQLGNGGTSGSIAGDVVDNGTLVFDRSDTYTFAGNISGSGGISQIGSGTTILTGQNTYTGPVVVTDGVLIANNVIIPGGSGVVTVTDGLTLPTMDLTYSGTFVFDRTTTYTYGGTFNGTGSLQQVGTGTLVLTGNNTYTGGTTIGAGSTLQLGNGGTSGAIAGNVLDNGTLVFDRSDTVTFTGGITGAGNVTQSGTGTLVFDTAQAYTGLTTVSAGTLMVGDGAHPGAQIAGNVLVSGGAKLQGHGTIVGAVTNTSGGTVAPGGSIGTLTVGSYTQGPTGTLEIEVAPAANSVLAVTGSAAIDGHAKFDFDPGAYGTRTYTFLTSTSLTGTFADVQTSSAPAGESFGVQYTATTANLVVAPTAPAQLYSDFQTASLQTAERFADQVATHQRARNCRPAEDGPGRAQEPLCPEVSVWWQTSGGAGSADAKNGGTAYSTRWIGGTGGIDAQTDSGLSFGLAATYVRSQLGISGGNGRATLDTYGISGSAGMPLFDGQLDATGLYMASNGQARRTVTPDGGTSITARSQPKNTAFGGTMQYIHAICFEDLVGLARLNYMSLDQDALHESGVAPYDFAMSAASKKALSADLGVRLSHIYHLRSGALLLPEATLAVRSYLDQDRPDVTGTLLEASGPSFSVSGPARANTALVAGFGVTAEKKDGFALFLRGDGRISGGEREGTISIGGRMVF